MEPIYLELLEDAERLIDQVSSRLKEQLQGGLDPADRKRACNALHDLRIAQSLLDKVVLS